MKKNVVITEITLEKFGFFAGVGTYVLKTQSGDVTIEVTDKKSNFGSGALTVYTAIINGTTYVDKPIGYYKRMFGAVVNHYSNFGGTNKVLSDTELSEKVANLCGTIQSLVDRLNKVCTLAKSDFEPIFVDIPTLSETFRNTLIANNTKAKEENEKAELAKKERESKAEKRELAKNFVNASDLQAELIKAVLANDTAKIAELSEKLKTA